MINHKSIEIQNKLKELIRLRKKRNPNLNYGSSYERETLNDRTDNSLLSEEMSRTIR